MAPDGAVWVGTTKGIVRIESDTWLTYSTADGFLQDRINCLVVAPDGAWWFGSDLGISRFDGKSWMHYDTVLERSGTVALTNAIDDCLVAPDGALWFGTSNRGALRYVP